MYNILIYDLQAQDWHSIKLVDDPKEAGDIAKEWEDNEFITIIEIT